MVFKSNDTIQYIIIVIIALILVFSAIFLKIKFGPAGCPRCTHAKKTCKCLNGKCGCKYNGTLCDCK
jgi:hypothetical protein